jgi:hypothetical protein
MASFNDVEKAGDAVAAIIAAGIIPAGLEMLDRPAAQAVEQFAHSGYDLEAAALLLVESDGTPAEIDEELERTIRVLKEHGASAIRVSRDEAERLKFWAGRKAAFAAMGRISPDYYCMDGTIPRKRIGEVLRFIAQMERKYGLRCPNVFHAGDGNLHPLIFRRQRSGPACAHRSLCRRGTGKMRAGRRNDHRRARVGVEKSTRCASSSARLRLRLSWCQALVRSRRAAQPLARTFQPPLRRARPHAGQRGKPAPS